MKQVSTAHNLSPKTWLRRSCLPKTPRRSAGMR